MITYEFARRTFNGNEFIVEKFWFVPYNRKGVVNKQYSGFVD